MYKIIGTEIIPASDVLSVINQHAKKARVSFCDGFDVPESGVVVFSHHRAFIRALPRLSNFPGVAIICDAFPGLGKITPLELVCEAAQLIREIKQTRQEHIQVSVGDPKIIPSMVHRAREHSIADLYLTMIHRIPTARQDAARTALLRLFFGDVSLDEFFASVHPWMPRRGAAPATLADLRDELQSEKGDRIFYALAEVKRNLGRDPAWERPDYDMLGSRFGLRGYDLQYLGIAYKKLIGA